MGRKRQEPCRLGAAVGLLFFLLAGCAGSQVRYPVPAGAGVKPVPLVATSFNFEPGVIEARQGDRLVLQVDNRSGAEHNLTVLSPGGEVVIDQNLPGERVTEVSLTLTESGTYPFYCNRFMHSAMGMKGKIVAAPD